MARATISQSGFVSRLDELERIGRIESFRQFWILNAIEVTADAATLETLKNLPEIEYAVESIPVELIAPVHTEQALLLNNGHEVGLGIVGAPDVWSMGIDGTGSLVCNFDTGVDVFHPALNAKYRGNNGGSPSECWFDPTGDERQYPIDIQGHGTHTMGIMLGSDGPDTVGVAPGAQWIAAKAIGGGGILRTIGDLLGAFQWAADPDGNPETIQDVPDVVNNSWGIPAGYFPECDQTFWEVIDNLEAAGVVAIFGAGNEGPGPESMRTPADRIVSSLNSFSVGAVLANNDTLVVANFSSRGPSACDHVTIKPEIVAPGVSVRSSHLNREYLSLSGTSMAAPHVAGAVALLRQYNPGATVSEIKTALLNSAFDCGPQGEDNSYGQGLLDIRAAIFLLPEATPVHDDILPLVTGVMYNYPNPFNGNTVIATLDPAGLGDYIGIYDISGRLVRRLSAAGHQSVAWDGADESGHVVAAGVYFARIEDKPSLFRKMLYLK
jgi:bacillopeptidase F